MRPWGPRRGAGRRAARGSTYRIFDILLKFISSYFYDMLNVPKIKLVAVII